MECRSFVPIQQVYDVPRVPECPKIPEAPEVIRVIKVDKECNPKSNMCSCLIMFSLAIITIVILLSYSHCYKDSVFQKSLVKPSWYPSDKMLLIGWMLFFFFITIQACVTPSNPEYPIGTNIVFGILLILSFTYSILFYQQSSMKYSSWCTMLMFMFLWLWMYLLSCWNINFVALIIPMLWIFYMVILTCNLASNN